MKSSKFRTILFTLSIASVVGKASLQQIEAQPQVQQQPYSPQYNPLYNTNQYNQQQFGNQQGFGNQQFSNSNQYNPSSSSGDFLISQQDLQKQSQNPNFQSNNVNNFFDSNKGDRPYSPSSSTGGLYDEFDESNYCPEHWHAFRQTCYRFVKSPKRSWHDVKKICKAYNADLANIDNVDEHAFILKELILSNNKFNRYWISARKTGIKSWVNDDGTAFLPIDDDSFADVKEYSSPQEFDLSDNRALLDKIHELQRENNGINFGQSFNQNPLLKTYNANWNNIGGLQSPITDAQGNLLTEYGRDRLVYGYSPRKDKWIFIPSYDFEKHFFICESKHLYSQENVYEKQDDKRTIMYGQEYAEDHKIPRGPFFTRQPNDTTFDTSKVRLINDVIISCLAVGWPTPTYRWYKEEYTNEKLIFREIDSLADDRYLVSGGDLLIQNPTQNQDQGWYHCVAENKFGRVRSNSAQLNFGFIMEFNLKRAAESGETNWGKALFCDPPQHYPDVKYYWSRGYFPNFVQEDQRVFSSHDGTLYFSSIESVDRANYSCNVQSIVSDTGRAGPFFPLRVMPKNDYQALIFANTFPKMFPEAPIAGSDIRLECVAFGYPVPSYNWTRKGSPLPRNAYQDSYNRVLIIPNATINDNGEYTCTIWNNRIETHKSLMINIQMKPNFTIPLKDKIKDYNSDVSFVCEAFAIPDVNYTWFKDGNLLDINKLDKDRYIIQDNVLTIKYLDPDKDNGMYQCRAENQLKAAFSSAQLKVLSMKPSFKKRRMQEEVYAVYNGNTTLVCDPEAAPRPKFQWKKDGNVIGSGGHRRIIPGTGTLIISPTSRDDEGLYTCVATNNAGTDESKTRLIVLQELRFTQALPPKIQTEINRYIYMQCDVYYDEILDVSFSWQHNGQLLKTDDFRRTLVNQNQLTVYNVTMLDAGEYECIVKSSVNQISSKTNVEVFGTPGAPGGVTVINIGKTHATIEWVDGGDNGKPIKWYNILGRTNWNQTFVNVSTEVRAREVDRYTFRMQAEVTNLSPWSSYEFSVAGVNDLGIGTPSSPSPIHRTLEDKPYIAPRQVGGGGGKIGDLTIKWEPLKPGEENAHGLYYKVFWRLHGKWEWASEELKRNENKGIATVPIPKDNYYTKYDVKVQPINNIGPGPESEVVTIYSAEDMPQVAPQQPIAKGFNSTCLNITWNAIEMTREKIRGRLIGHRLKYWKKNQAEEDATFYLSRTTRNWALIVGLEPDTYYLVKVMAYNAAGEGPESERYLERTYRKAPQKPPSSVHLTGIDPSTVKVVWRYISPEQDEEPVEGYKVRVWESDQDMVTANDTIIPLGKRLEATIGDLTPGKNYKMRVLAFSNGGDGRMSSPTIQFQMGNTERRNSSNRATLNIGVMLLTFIACLLFKDF